MTLNCPKGHVKNILNQFTSQAAAWEIVQTACTDVAITLLLLHWDHLWPDVATLDGWVDLRDVLWFTPRIILQYRQRMETRKKEKFSDANCKDYANSELWHGNFLPCSSMIQRAEPGIIPRRELLTKCTWFQLVCITDEQSVAALIILKTLSKPWLQWHCTSKSLSPS